VRLTPSFVASQAYLIAGVSWTGMLIWFWLLRHGDATRASAWFFLNPVIGVVLGAALLGEPLRVQDLLGSAAVALGIHLVQRG
jgi:drug/metabolite transporter (DMT)-like permease